MRRVIAVLIAAGLAIGVVVWWLSPGADSPPSTEAVATTTTSTTTTTVATTTTTEPETTTTGVPDSHVVETVEEAEEILRELWFGWFEGIYNQDEDRIREVVATEQMFSVAVNAFGAPFDQPPTRDDILLDTQLLRSDAQCLVTWGTLDVTEFRGPDAMTDSVQVLRFFEGSWRFMTSWIHPEDLWEADCEAELLPSSS